MYFLNQLADLGSRSRLYFWGSLLFRVQNNELAFSTSIVVSYVCDGFENWLRNRNNRKKNGAEFNSAPLC